MKNRHDKRLYRIGGAYEDFVAELLDRATALSLFEPMNERFSTLDVDCGSVGPRQAAKVLRHLAKTGEVDWEIAFAE
ncbi:hypothetical protein [Chelativorans sp. M5D2P16]|uniref:hypothetical protein n=1 Tax=Chelativorans sp. M5D2P16 TaxID=3095678 RepID=UPI002ACA7158|nr:hypothetical protein [Chelativorans sp. M5D2P16]MDZ5696686.1 hypothetical protein [Chelativorans sp. M5D2P16]